VSELPKSIRVGYRDYLVEAWDYKAASASEKFGECDRNYAIIRVSPEYGEVQTARTLLHEVLHAIWTNANLPSGEGTSDEEAIVTVMSNHLAQIWRDNPEFVAFLTESLSPPA
jgi:hypothetical protein